MRELRDVELAGLVKLLPARRQIGVVREQLIDRALDERRVGDARDIRDDDDLRRRRDRSQPLQSRRGSLVLLATARDERERERCRCELQWPPIIPPAIPPTIAASAFSFSALIAIWNFASAPSLDTSNLSNIALTWALLVWPLVIVTS